MNTAQAIRMKGPAHPGGFVKTEIIEPLGLSVTDAAAALGVTRPALSAFLNECASLSPEMALRIEKAFGVSMNMLMRMQNSFDIAQARKREGEIKVPPFQAKPGDLTRSYGLTVFVRRNALSLIAPYPVVAPDYCSWPSSIIIFIACRD